jgi:preprotein translocase subunit YajC
MTTIPLKIITHTLQVATVISCIWYLSKRHSIQPYRLFAAGWIIVLCYDLVMVIIGLINPVKNHWVYNIAFPLIQLFSMYFFIHQPQQKKLALLMFLFTGLATCNLILLQGGLTLNTYSITLGGIMILFLASAKIFHLYKLDTSQSLFSDPDFWICSGFILYWGLATPFFAMYNFLWQTYPDFFIIYFYTVNFGFTIVQNICIIKALQCSLNTARR